MASISLQDIRKSFGKTEVIHGVDLEIADGEFIVIVGPSGCGKSTLLRMVAGLETVTAGEVRINDKRVNDLEPMDRDIAMVFQNYALYPHMSVFDNMAYGLKIAGTPKPEIAERVAQAAELLQIADYLKRKPRELSGGQRQRVAMGRAIVRKPAVFLFDEPLSNLDAKLRVQMRLEIKELQRKLGVTSLYVTHDQVEAMTLADRVVVMNDGRAEQVGTPLDIYTDPATRFVGSFIGSPPMNFLPPDALNSPAAVTGASLIGIRPEHLRPAPADHALLTGTVKFTEALGAETLVHMILPKGEQITLRHAGLPQQTTPRSQLGLVVEPDHLYLFDSSGGRLPAT
ncbi:MAG: sn-glycerol-3-phosphate ABC transporter ATP-binding protein UgpC [Paracoccus sp. (in: a-proteobacteria)]